MAASSALMGRFRDDYSCSDETLLTPALTTPTVTAYYKPGTSEQTVGSAKNAVDSALSRSVTVIEEMLGIGIVNRNDREQQHVAIRHALSE